MGGRTKSAWNCSLVQNDTAWKDTQSKYIQWSCLKRCSNDDKLHLLYIQLAATLDIFPTIATLAGADLPNVKMDGYDMTPIILKNQQVL